MTLEQMSSIKRWHVGHRHRHPVEGFAWDLVLTLWVMSLPGALVGLLLNSPLAAGACVVAAILPSVYAAGRRMLHRRGLLRCDWLSAARP
jgi:hypothetical protein